MAEDNATPEKVLRYTRTTQKVAWAVLIVGLLSDLVAVLAVNLLAPETVYKNYLGIKTDHFTNELHDVIIVSVFLSVLLLGIANRVNYFSARANASDANRLQLIAVTIATSVVGGLMLSFITLFGSIALFSLFRLTRLGII